MMCTLRLHILLLCALLAGACSKERADIPTPGASGDTGALILKIAATRSEGEPVTGYDPMQHLTVRVYNAEGGLIRKYTSREELPGRLELLAGTYRIAVEAGESGKTATQGFASFEKRLYRGEKEFTVQAGTTEHVEVVCKNVDTAVEVQFDASVAEALGEEFASWVAAAGTFDLTAVEAGDVPALRFTKSATGYFDLLEEQTTLVWQFSGVHPERGAVVKTGKISDIRQPGKYRLEFAWSDDLPGFIDCFVLKVDTSTENEDDTIIFSPDPTIEGDDFDITKVQKYESGLRNVRITTMKPLKEARLTIDGTATYDLLTATVEGMEITRESETVLVVTFSDTFFGTLSAGDHTFSFSTNDTAGGAITVPAIFRLQGLLPVGEADCDLWHNTLTLRAVTFDPTTEVLFTLRASDGTTQTLVGKAEADDYRVATFAPEWVEATDPKRPAGQLPQIYRPAEGKGIFAGHNYEYSAQIGNRTFGATFTAPAAPTAQAIPDADMENPALSCFTINNQTTDFWGSGNNKTLNIDITSLCTQQPYGGSQCALLASDYAGMMGINMLAAGNLFSGTFVKESTSKGVVGFGKRLEWTARPKALRFRYHATIGTVDCTKHTLNGSDPIPSGQMDKARVFAAIVDWTAPRAVASGTAAPTGTWDPQTWDPEHNADQTQGPIIGYASLWIEASTSDEEVDETGMVTAEIPFYYYDTETRPSKAYTVVISASSNAYGDYMNGCQTNRLYIDDFEWVY